MLCSSGAKLYEIRLSNEPFSSVIEPLLHSNTATVIIFILLQDFTLWTIFAWRIGGTFFRQEDMKNMFSVLQQKVGRTFLSYCKREKR